MLNLKTANALQIDGYDVCDTQKGDKQYLKIYAVEINTGNTHNFVSFSSAVNNVLTEKGPGLYEFIFRVSYDKQRNRTDIMPVYCNRL